MFLEQLRFLKQYLSMQRNAALIPTARAVPVDTGLSGTPRFAYGLGDAPAILASTNVFTATEGIYAGSTTLSTTDTIADDYTDCVIVIGGEEHCLVIAQSTSVDEQDTATTVFELETPIQRSRVAGQMVSVTAFQVVITNGTEYPMGTSVLGIQTQNIVVPGDRLALLLNDAVTPTLSVYLEIQAVEIASEALGLFTYTVTLSRPLQTDLTQDTRVFLQARPAYRSERLPVHCQASLVLLDVCGGETMGKGAMDMTVYARLRDAAGNSLREIRGKVNSLVWLRGIGVRELACSYRDRGTLGVVGNRMRLVLDEQGRAGFGMRFPGSMNSGSRFHVNSQSGFTMRVETDAGTTAVTGNPSVDALADLSATTSQFIIRISGNPGQVLWFREQLQDHAHSIEYTLSINLRENETFQSTGLVMKPVFPSVADLESHEIETNRGMVLC